MLGLHWLSEVVQEWPRNPLKCVEWSQWGRQPLAFAGSKDALLLCFRRPGACSWALFVKWHCINANTFYLSALHKSAGRWRARLPACPRSSPGAPCPGGPGQAGLTPPAAPAPHAGRSPPTSPPRLRPPFAGALLEGSRNWKNSASRDAIEEKWRLSVNL